MVMNAITLLKLLEDKSVFRMEDIQRIKKCSQGYAWQVLARLRKKGIIKKVSENSYTTKSDINVVATNLLYPSYISFLYASYYYGYTEQIVRIVQLATTTRKKEIDFEKYTIKFIPIKHFFGYKKIRISEGEIFIAENEKLCIDALLRPKECGNFNEIEKMFENAKISKKKIIEYLKRTKMQSLIKRAGFLLEKHQNIDVRRHFELDKNYTILNPFQDKCTVLNSKWRVKT